MMTTDWQYMGQFSGEDHTTFEQWDKAYGEALRTNNLGELVVHFGQFLADRTFMIMLDGYQREIFYQQLQVVNEMTMDALERWMDDNPASETK